MQAAIAVPKACERIGLSRSKFYELLNQRAIPSIKVAGVGWSALKTWIAASQPALPTAVPRSLIGQKL